MSDLALPVAQVLGYLRIPFAMRDRHDAWMRCPFHEEAVPSCHVDLRSGKWFCYGCQVGGGLEEFVTKIVHDPISAIAVIHRARSMPVPSAIDDFEEAWRESAKVDPVVGWSRFHKVNWMDSSLLSPVTAYLLGRGFTRETLRAFDVRLTEWGEYPVAFQIHNWGELVGYVRRRIDSGEKKYLYNEGFDAKEHVAYFCVDPSAPCLIVEGVLDLMKAAQYGARRVAALLGWHLNSAKLDRLVSFGVKRFVVATDNTPTGESGWGLFQEFLPRWSVRFQFPAHRKDIGELTRMEFLAGMPQEVV